MKRRLVADPAARASDSKRGDHLKLLFDQNVLQLVIQRLRSSFEPIGR
ncbi:MAG: hypothetical protein H0U13_07775 [Gemmatimonadaceae bacterium]|nr:hypothetical protein [Gemmatimonadaceae bacterium]